jgi:hypothetical protein
MASGRLADYLGKGLAAERPATLNLHPEAVGLWYSTDTDTLSAWDGSAWIDDLSGGGIPDAPSDGTTYGRKNGAWAAVGSGGVQTVVAGTGVSVDSTDPANPVVSATGGAGIAENVTYDNAVSGLAATNVQAAIDELAAGAGGDGVTSTTIQRIVTSTDPNHATIDGDMLIVLPVPKVVAAAQSDQTYGTADSVSSVSVVVPATVRTGDMLVLLVGSSSAAATPSGYTLIVSRDAPRTQVSGGLGLSTAFRKTAGASDAGQTVTISQTTAGRMSAVLVVVRAEGASPVSVVAQATDSFAAATNINHPIPNAIAPTLGCLAIATFACAFANTAGDTSVSMPTGWTPVTPTLAPVTPTYQRLRSWVAYRRMRQGEGTADAGSCAHGTNTHDSSSIVLILGVTP